MAGGWTKDGAVQDQIDASVEDEIKRARDQLTRGVSAKQCIDCDADIPEARRKALPGVQLCVACQALRESEQQTSAGFNRRGSKDSQLR